VELPPPINRAERYAWQQCHLLAEQTVLLRQVLSCLPAAVHDAASERSWREVREPQPASPPPARQVEVHEPAPPPTPPPEEPAPNPGSDPAAVPTAGGGRPDSPPRAGRGSGLDVWRQWADQVGVAYPAEGRRDDIVAACVAAGVIAP